MDLLKCWSVWGKVAYRLRLPEESKIHPVFHISQLKKVIGQGHTPLPLPVSLSKADEVIIVPDEFLDTRYDEEGHLEVLVKWKNLPAHENSWMRVSAVQHQFPDFPLEDKLVLLNGGIDKPLRVYTRRARRMRRENIEE